MRFPWLFVLVLMVLLTVGVVVYLRGSKRPAPTVVWIANTAEMRMLPTYRRALQRTRYGVLGLAASLVVLMISAAFMAGAPVDRHVEHPRLASRDIVLCLDASGSMLPYDGQILRQFADMVDHFRGERMALQMWSAQTVVKFPLTDDYELMSEVLNHAADVIDRGYLGPAGEFVMVTPELSEYLEGVDSPVGIQASSLVGDGLATCVLGFDHRDSERSRTILLATDNEVMGEQIYDIVTAVEFATEQDIEIIALYPGDTATMTSEGEQMRNVVEKAGGSFFNANDPSAIADIIDQIEQQQLAEIDGPVEVKETDKPKTSVLWATWSLLFLMLIGAVRRL